jgi:hypothetical protein
MAHELTQDKEVDPSRSQFGAIGMAEAVGTNPHCPRASAVRAEHLAQTGFGERTSARRATKDHKALWGQTSLRPLERNVCSTLDEKCTVYWHDALPAPLANHSEPAHPHVDVAQAQRANLACPKTPEHHGKHDRPVTVRFKVGQEGTHIVDLKAFGKALGLVNQPAASPRPPRADMAQQSMAGRAPST